MRKQLLFLLLVTDTLLSESLSVITVDEYQDTSSTNISATKIDKTQIENTITGNGFISSILEKNPNISIDDDSKRSTTAGEITPGKISINEAPFYQNNFSIDGISNSSLLDPSLSNTFSKYDVPGNENEIFLDLDLIEEITVYDSGISAEYGNFTGGVIDAKTIRAEDELKYKISHTHTSDSHTKLHVNNKETFDQALSDSQQPRFEKNFYNMYVSSPINESNGLIFSYSKKQSIIPGAYFDGFKDKTRENESFFAKWSHYFEDDSILDLSWTYSPYESTHFIKDVKDSDTKVYGGGYNLKANYEKNYNFWNLKTNLALKGSENSRDSANYYKAWYKSPTMNWGEDSDNGANYSKEGGTGSIVKSQNSLEYNLKFNSDSFEYTNISHKLSTGLDLAYHQSEYNRKESFYVYDTVENNNLINCNGDNEACVQGEQFFTQRKIYDKEQTEVNMASSGLYFQDRLEYERFEFTPGVRFDYNNYLKNKDFAYRLNSSIKPFNTNTTVVYGGLNRYYGKSFLGYKLREARDPYYEQYRSSFQNVARDWGSSSDKESNKYVFSDLKTPYTDESVIGLKQDISNARINLKYVKRKAKDKFTKHTEDYKVFTMPDGVTQAYYKPITFKNEGYSTSRTLSLNVGPTKPIKFNSFNLGYSFSTSINKTSANSDDYDDLLDNDSDQSNKISYNGVFYDKNNIPIESDPKNLNLHLNMAFIPIEAFNIPLSVNLNSVIKHRLAYSKVEDSGETTTYQEKFTDKSTISTEVPVYEKVDYKSSTTVDLKASFKFKLKEKNNLIFSTEINNLFDKVKNLENSSKNYETGRQFWFTLTYKKI